MSGAALSEAPTPGRSVEPERPPEDLLFRSLVVSDPPRARGWVAFRNSLIGHVVAVGALILVPILWPSPLPEQPDYVKLLIYNPPPPPPPPLPKGSALLPKPERAKPVTPEPDPHPKLTAQIDVPKEVPLRPEDKTPENEQHGSPTGSDLGVAEGMEVGVEGGVVGGVPGGVLGGVVGGTGDGPVMDYDQPPRPIKITQPQYPQDAFVKKIEGTVVLEILIDSTGHVVRARVLQSIPALDTAALRTVYQWVFSPAIKHGRPVATLANAPVAFRIY